jgi:hypothetical protein
VLAPRYVIVQYFIVNTLELEKKRCIGSQDRRETNNKQFFVFESYTSYDLSKLNADESFGEGSAMLDTFDS